MIAILYTRKLHIGMFFYDEDEIIPDPPFVTEDEMNKRINALNQLKKGLANFGIPFDIALCAISSSEVFENILL